VQHETSPTDIRRKREEWLTEAIALCPEIVRPEADETLRPLVRRCNAKSKSRFWTWLRLTCAKSEDTVGFLAWMRESRCPLEITKAKDGFQYVISGNVALIDVGEPSRPAVWQIPVERLEWALSLHPVRLRELPPTESSATREIRLLRRRLVRDGWCMTPQQKDYIIHQLNDAELRKVREYPPAPRFFLTKSVDGVETAVHRLYLDAGRDDEVEARNGNYLDFTDVKVTVTVEAAADNGVGVRRGNRPLSETQQFIAPNLYIVDSPVEQEIFENTMLQVRTTPRGDIDQLLSIECGTFGGEEGV
jgi:hypothetical protein